MRKLEESSPSADSTPPPGCASSQIYPSSDPSPGLPTLPSTLPTTSSAAAGSTVNCSQEENFTLMLNNIHSVNEDVHPIITTPEGSTLAVLQPVPTGEVESVYENTFPAAAPRTDPCKIMDYETTPTGRIPQLDGEDGEALCDDLDDEDSAVIVDFWVPRRRRNNVIYSTLKNVTTCRDNIL